MKIIQRGDKEEIKKMMVRKKIRQEVAMKMKMVSLYS